MKSNKDELERPREWLHGLREDPQLYRLLLDDAGSLALAAHRIACARCRTRACAVTVPNGTEIHAAAHEIRAHVPHIGIIPPAADLAEDCELAGVPVILSPRAA